MIYLNNAATSWPKPAEVYDKVDQFFRGSVSNAARSGGGGSNAAAREIFFVREKIAEFFQVDDSAKFAFNSGATESLNTVLKGVLKAGDHVITSKAEHNSVLRPLSRLQKEKNIEISLVDLDSNGEIIYQEIEDYIQAKTKLIVLTHASNVLGTINDLKRAAQIAAEADILFLVDAAQTAGVVDYNLSEIKADFTAFAGHKSLFGPAGIGALYVRDHTRLQPLKEGGTGSDSLSRSQPEIMPDYLEAGTANLPGIAGLGAGIDFINSVGRQKIHQKEMELLEYIIDSLLSIPQIKVYGKKNIENRTAVTAFNIADRSSNQIAFQLENQHQIELRAGLHCAPLLHKKMGTVEQGMLRVSPGYFNEKKEIDEFLNILESLI